MTWTSSNTAVTTVSSTGIVTAKSAGDVVITATSENGCVATSRIQVMSSSTIKFTSLGARNVTTKSAEVFGTISYTGTRPSSVGVYYGKSISSMTKAGSDTIGHSKNPFDAWYSQKSLVAGTTYYIDNGYLF